MPDWKLWREMAEGALRSAEYLFDKEHSSKFFRSAISRYYYASFQAATSFLLYSGLTPPQGEEGWSHTSTPRLLAENLAKRMDRRMAISLSECLHDLYNLRIFADYQSDALTDRHRDKVREAAKKAKFVIRLVFSELE